MTSLVLGAGMVGVATALALQERGHKVVLVDRGSPGSETSHGNAGMIQVEAAEPYAFPRNFGTIAAAMLGRTNDVRWHWNAIASHVRPLLSYFANSSPLRHAAISSSYVQLTRRATHDHAIWISAAGAEALIRRDGYLVVHRTESRFDAAVAEAERLSSTYGVHSRTLTSAALAAAEPGLLAPLAGAIHWPEPWSCSDPGKLVGAYARLFVERGGQMARADAASLERSGAGWRIRSSDGPIDGSHAIVALGPWSADLLERFGHRLPMFRKRGYHRHFAVTDGPRLPIMDAERGAFCSPMDRGLRVCTGAEFARVGAPGTPLQIKRAEASIRTLFKLGDTLDAAPWVGNRPCMPDMLPVVGQVPDQKNLWVHTGHGHQGFTLGPTTARLLAAQISGEHTDPDLTRALRFGRWQH